MKLKLINKSRQKIFFSINEDEYLLIEPWGNMEINVQYSGELKLNLKHDYESKYTKKKFKDKIYHIVLNSEYIFGNLNENDEIYLTREKIRINKVCYYDRFFAYNMNALLLWENHYIYGEDTITKRYKKDFEKSDLADIFLLDPIFYIIICPILLVPDSILLTGLGIFLIFIYNIKVALIYFACYYLLYVISGLIGKYIGVNLIKFVIGRIFGKKSADDFIGDYPEFLRVEYISNYYSDPNRRPFYFNDYESE